MQIPAGWRSVLPFGPDVFQKVGAGGWGDRRRDGWGNVVEGVEIGGVEIEGSGSVFGSRGLGMSLRTFV